MIHPRPDVTKAEMKRDGGIAAVLPGIGLSRRSRMREEIRGDEARHKLAQRVGVLACALVKVIEGSQENHAALLAVMSDASLAGRWCAGGEPKDDRHEGEAESERLNTTQCGGASVSARVATIANQEADAQSEKWTDERDEDENGSERIDEKPECAHRPSGGSM